MHTSLLLGFLLLLLATDRGGRSLEFTSAVLLAAFSN